MTYYSTWSDVTPRRQISDSPCHFVHSELHKTFSRLTHIVLLTSKNDQRRSSSIDWDKSSNDTFSTWREITHAMLSRSDVTLHQQESVPHFRLCSIMLLRLTVFQSGSQNAHFKWSAALNRGHNSREDPPREKQITKVGAGEGKNNEKSGGGNPVEGIPRQKTNKKTRKKRKQSLDLAQNDPREVQTRFLDGLRPWIAAKIPREDPKREE